MSRRPLAVAVTDKAPSALSYQTNPVVFTKGTAITNDSPHHMGGPIASYAVTPALPAGLSLDAATGVVSGTRTALAPEGRDYIARMSAPHYREWLGEWERAINHYLRHGVAQMHG